jgi:serine/threonine protein phosphatase PrpC
VKGRIMRLSSAGATDIGRTRDHNEDSILVLADVGVFCVADGMGGAYGGEQASREVVEALEREFAPALPGGAADFADLVLRAREAVNRASRAIQAASEKAAAVSGTTAALLVFDQAAGGRAEALHAGDSRIYRLRGQSLRQITRDHSIAEYAGIRDEADLPHIFRGVITRAVGLSEEVALEGTAVDVEPGDLFLLCSDGLTRMLDDERIRSLLTRQPGGLREVAADLVAEANRAGGHDNVSVILVRVDADRADEPAPEPDGEAREGGPPSGSETGGNRRGGWHGPAAWIAGILAGLGVWAWWSWIR